MRKIVYLVLIILVLGLVIARRLFWSGPVLLDQQSGKVLLLVTLAPTVKPTIEPVPKTVKKDINLKVPFVPQAPFGDWEDPKQQDGCEEITSLMAIYWAKDKSLTKEEALQKILEISDYEQEVYGEYRDTSGKDTVERIIKDYFQYGKARVMEIGSWEDIYNELERSNLVIVPMDGQKLNNPYYSSPGPQKHMIVVRGYSFRKNEFITNDPGTRRGEGYRYSVEAFFDSIRDYPTGYHEPITEIKKVMIVVEK
jgi:hypothetical protein